MATYKSKDGQDYVIPGVGRTQGGLIETDQVIENSNFELVDDAQAKQAAAAPAQPAVPQQYGQPAAAPAAPAQQVAQPAVAPAAPQTQTNTEIK